MSRINTTFGGGEPTWANACVGNNGYPSYWDYAKGFSQAANLLIDMALQDQGLHHPVDELIYPVCFNMRHSVELRLKGAISELIALEQCRGRGLEFDLAGSHDIGHIWQFFAQSSESIDDRYITINGRLDSKLVDLAEIDATGQTFRYPLDRESQKHLVNVALINFVKLKESFSELENSLDELHRLNKYLRDEYSLKTFTKRLSRKNIFDIASILPNRDHWKEESFGTIKIYIKNRYKIGSRELSDCIKIIETHCELSPIIGIPMKLSGVSECDVTEFAQLWCESNDIPSDKSPIKVETLESASKAMFASLNRDAAIQQKVWKQMGPKLTPEILAGLSALFYFAHSLDFSEQYILIYEKKLKEARVAFEVSEVEVRSKYFHIFEKTNVIYNVLRSVYFLKKNELAERLVSTHGLHEKFMWLDDARSWSLFKKPKY